MAIAMGAPLDVSPHEALLHCVRVSAGEVVYATQQIAKLDHDEVLQHPTVTTERVWTGGEEGGGSSDEEKKLALDLHIWIRVRQEALDRLARFSKMALDAGVDERRVRIAEGMAAVLGPVLEAIFKELGLTDEQKKKAPAILRANLLTLEGEVMGANGKDPEEVAA